MFMSKFSGSYRACVTRRVSQHESWEGILFSMWSCEMHPKYPRKAYLSCPPIKMHLDRGQSESSRLEAYVPANVQNLTAFNASWEAESSALDNLEKWYLMQVR
ncbi:hypothetical protein DPMN_073179 [Dreissena polymorpha]|uniref:Uncharacterized protein n=1 Tax=Dreissena polymorpha TaxID=45954 RepID=A0A9D4BYK0_DREPO|nr:hypothetical protein DPMN_073179 [Dreissena polymorpha]